ncbi:MAG: hypothetical protein KGL39_60745 [Patescibacteria group bacterium]|nr:hypothetical protein [Patescibacteria group bacterium]
MDYRLTAPVPLERARVPDGWKLAMFILQSGLYAKMPEEERAVCDALVQENPYIAVAPQPPKEPGHEP